MRRGIPLLIAAAVALLVPSSEVSADQPKPSQERRLKILEREEPERLDPAFEMIMEKLDEDLRYVISSPIRMTPKATAVTGLTVLGTLFLINVDEKWAEEVVTSREGKSDRAYERLRVLGRNVPATTAGLYLLGYFLEDRSLKSRALEGFEAVAITALVTAGSGYLIGHKEPEDSTEAGEFEPLNKYHSMPDMSSSLVFSLAGVFAYERPWHQALLYYSIAAGTAVSRVYYEEAWPSDVFLGSVIGTAIGRTVASRARKGAREDVTVLPMLEFNAKPVLGLRIEFRL
ncbi:MAG: phosphatase PAP2 family protein [bacterium]|nr:MAG: phosphatase PAP2 family protein [bacterium]